MRSRRLPSPQVLVPAAAVAIALVVIVVFSASVLLSPAPSPSPTARATATAVTTLTPTEVPTPTEEPSPTEQPTPTPAPLPSTVPTITSALLERSDPNGVWAVRYRYPKIAAGTSPFADQLNTTIAQQVEATATQFAEGPAAVPSPGGGTNSLEGSYSIALVTPRFLSVRFTEIENLGGAHPATQVGTQTFDLSTGQPIGLLDVFTDQAAGFAAISANSRVLLRAQLGASDQLDAGTSPDQPANFAAWALTAKGLEITFQEYQVAPSAYGTPVIVIPWSDLKDVLNPNGPGAALLGS